MKPTKLTSLKAVFAMAFLCCSNAISAQQFASQGAESKGLGSTRFGIQNVWSSYNSPTDMHSDSMVQLGLSIARPYSIALLKSYGASLVLNKKQNAYGGYFSYVGYSVSHFIAYGLSISKELHSSVILGISIVDLDLIKIIHITGHFSGQLFHHFPWRPSLAHTPHHIKFHLVYKFSPVFF